LAALQIRKFQPQKAKPPVGRIGKRAVLAVMWIGGFSPEGFAF
jgi:hypothetical protein